MKRLPRTHSHYARVDPRLALMFLVLVVMGVAFHVLSDGVFLSPENLYNIAQQTAVVGIVSTVMVLVIVALGGLGLCRMRAQRARRLNGD